jgi:crotonobetainyl-CoA:carnitine CoA-transferase CaiB-like acyl-CoA transferase
MKNDVATSRPMDGVRILEVAQFTFVPAAGAVMADWAAKIVAGLVAARPYAEWFQILSRGEGQWAAVQNSWEVGQDPSLRCNGLIAQIVDADGIPRELIANPVQFDETPAKLTRAPQFAEHTDEVLLALGISEDELLELKIDGAVT